ncbi:MAG: DUF882 domain-containing protein [Alphaproteobacteria bacterium]|nr:DUF882 domain-containing protein [Alphaproteobacteria bacterium]
MHFDALDRRKLVLSGLGAAAGLILPSAAALAAPSGAARRLTFKNLHTHESLAAAYWADGHYQPQACRQIDRLLRDHRTGDVAPMSRRLLDALFELQVRLGGTAPFEVISGYRSPKSNARLASTRSGVARRSLHMRGMAIDIRVPGCSLKRLRAHAVEMKVGGVGYYPKSGFIHVDVGRVRYW